MSDQSDTPKVGKQGMALVATGVLVALVGAFVLGLTLAGAIPGWTEKKDSVQDLSPATTRPIGTPLPDPPTGGPTGPRTPTDRISSRGDPPPEPQGAAPVIDAQAEEALRAIRDRRAEEETRLAERARLASESPLTPSLWELSDLVRPPPQTEEGAQTAQGAQADAAPGAAVSPDPGALTPRAEDPPAQTYTLARGAVIPAVLESAIDSALPGLVRARVSGHVYDSTTGAHILIPRGAALVGTYRQASQAGAQRLFVTWTDLRQPDGTPLGMEDFSSLGADGAAGIRGRRSTGLFKALGAAILFDLAGNATQILTGENTQQDEGDIGALIAGATGSATSRVAEQYLGQLLSTGTRFRVSAGAIMNVLVEEDMDLPAVRNTR